MYHFLNFLPSPKFPNLHPKPTHLFHPMSPFFSLYETLFVGMPLSSLALLHSYISPSVPFPLLDETCSHWRFSSPSTQSPPKKIPTFFIHTNSSCSSNDFFTLHWMKHTIFPSSYPALVPLLVYISFILHSTALPLVFSTNLLPCFSR